ncbi:MAG: peptide-methionine (R)-S-oxide reductase MsrB [Fimbriimonadaceae bacterium]
MSEQDRESRSQSGREIPQTEAEWRQRLSREQYIVLREKGTERAFTGKYWNHKGDGTYACAGCGEVLFDSVDKFDSGCGWPSFSAAIDNRKIRYEEDLSFGMRRIEVMCANCGGHLGHVFNDGPPPTGMRYCINSVSIDFADRRPGAQTDEEATAEKD